MGRTLEADAFKAAVKKLKDMPDSPLKCKKQNKHIKARAEAHENLAYFAQFCVVMFAYTDLGEPLSSYRFSNPVAVTFSETNGGFAFTVDNAYSHIVTDDTLPFTIKCSRVAHLPSGHSADGQDL